MCHGSAHELITEGETSACELGNAHELIRRDKSSAYELVVRS